MAQNERFLYEIINEQDNREDVKIDLDIVNNLNQNIKLRKYQEDAFKNFIYFYENNRMREKYNQLGNLQVLFHMATGSGKTLIMAGLIIYLYKKGYRNFIFFVNRSQIVKKTIENFTEKASNKFLFNDNLIINGKNVKIKTVNNFENYDKENINICFTTIQSLFSNLWIVKQNNIGFDEFYDKKIVFIADEAHHLNADTLKGEKYEFSDDEIDEMTSSENSEYDENELSKSWEYTINQCFYRNNENVLLEFTATSGIDTNENIKKNYLNKIIYNYSLASFRKDGYSKEIKSIATNFDNFEKIVLALSLSIYRQMVFNDYGKIVKPVVLLKSKTISQSKENYNLFIENINDLDGKKLKEILSIVKDEQKNSIASLVLYLANKKIDLNAFAEIIKTEFNENVILSTNDNKDLEKQQSLLNNLEDKSNRVRLIFTVDKLNEGWDVLNLYDIVRLYENANADKYTNQEAQLIGRGARYYPFVINENEDKYKRKYDSNSNLDLKVCETLYYHCTNESVYIKKLHDILSKMGLEMENAANEPIVRKVKLKDSFRADDLYKSGFVFANEQLPKNENDYNIQNYYKNGIYVNGEINSYKETKLIDEKLNIDDENKRNTISKTISEISKEYYNLVRTKILSSNNISFNKLKEFYPNLISMRQFIIDEKYIGNIKICITTTNKELLFNDYEIALTEAFKKIDEFYKNISKVKGSYEYKAKHLYEYFDDIERTFTKVDDKGGEGYSQNDIILSNFEDEDKHTLSIRKDLQDNDKKNESENNKWYVYEDNIGTTEEKYFVWYFSTNYIERLYNKYEKVRLIRNDSKKKLKIFKYDDGKAFEPDFILFLKEKDKDYMNIQIFIEPKGTAYFNNDNMWKEEMLKNIKTDADIKNMTFKGIKVDANEISGAPFFNHKLRLKEFDEFMEKLLK